MSFGFLGFADVNGVLRGKSYTSAAFDAVCERGHVASPDAILANDPLDQAITTLHNIGVNAGSGDVRLEPEINTLRSVPWRPESRLCLGDLYWADGSPCALSSRQVLRSALHRLEGEGLRAMVAFEYEVRLWRLQDGEPATGAQCYSARGVDEIATFSERLHEASEMLGLDLIVIHTEGGAGLVEINVDATDGQRAADNAIVLKYAVHEVARQCGLRASFLAKPVADEEGSSGHVHVSLWSRGSNVMSSDDPTRPNLTMRHAVGGLLEHLPAMSLILNPNINSYKRLVPGFFAPVTACWGIDNRSTAVRAVAIDTPNARVEVRRPGADANPYLVLAAIITAMVEGLQNSTDPSPAVEGDSFAADAGTYLALPSTLESAITAFSKDAQFGKLLGQEFSDYYVTTRLWELHAWQRAVTDWEIERYSRIT